MELNLIATGIELLGASVAKLTVDNTIVDIENDAQRSFGMTINEPQFQNIEKTKEIFFNFLQILDEKAVMIYHYTV